MKLALAALTCCFLAITATHAQERTAAGGTETQMTWSALSGQIHAVGTKTDAVNTRVDQIVVCAKKGMVYAPGAAGADAQGCLEAAQAGNSTNNLTNLTNALNALTNNYTNIVTCNKAGQTYDGTKCVASASKDDRWVVNTTYSKSAWTNSSSVNSAITWYKNTVGKPWSLPLCSSVAGYGDNRRCTNSGQLCYNESYSVAPTYSNCSSCNGNMTGGTVTGSFVQYKCD